LLSTTNIVYFYKPSFYKLFKKYHKPNFDKFFFQQDGASPHYALRVRDYLNEVFPQRWFGRRGSISSVARGSYSPSLLARRKKEGENALSAHLHGLFAVIGVSNDF